MTANRKLRSHDSERAHTLLVVLLAEFRRAIAAERRYQNLKLGGADALAREGIDQARIPNLVFQEFYALEGSPKLTEHYGGKPTVSRPSMTRSRKDCGSGGRPPGTWDAVSSG